MERPFDWISEAKSVINSERSFLNHIEISSLTTFNGVYLNIETLEKQSFCVLLNSRGFRVVAKAFDQDINVSQTCYETAYTLLSNISLNYSKKFHELVTAKLQEFGRSCEGRHN